MGVLGHFTKNLAPHTRPVSGSIIRIGERSEAVNCEAQRSKRGRPYRDWFQIIAPDFGHMLLVPNYSSRFRLLLSHWGASVASEAVNFERSEKEGEAIYIMVPFSGYDADALGSAARQ